MDIWQSLVLGVVEGVTEYLPVSSTGHLLLAQRAMGVPESDASNAYAICIQSGAIVAVLGLYAVRVKHMVMGMLGRNKDGARLVRNLVAAFLPAAVIGVLFDDMIERFLFGLWPIVAAWFLGGVVLLVASGLPRFGPSTTSTGALNTLSVKGAVLIGLGQCLAMWPGTSRSLVTILAGVLAGLSLSAAVEFSFLLGVITLLAATAYKGVGQGSAMLAAYSWTSLITGFIAAWLTAVLAVRWMVGYLTRHSLAIFGYWRIGLSGIVSVLLLMGVLSGR